MRRSAAVLSLLVCSLSCWAQLATSFESPRTNQSQPKQSPIIRAGQVWFASLTDPACPVGWFPGPEPSTQELRILYYPMAHEAVIKDPKSLLLHIVFSAFPQGKTQTILFSRMEDGAWEAKVDLHGMSSQYAAYWVEDRTQKQVDNNHGEYFDVMYCDSFGHRSFSAAQEKAQTFTGGRRSLGLERPTDYEKAAHVLEDFLRPAPNAYN